MKVRSQKTLKKSC